MPQAANLNIIGLAAIGGYWFLKVYLPLPISFFKKEPPDCFKKEPPDFKKEPPDCPLDKFPDFAYTRCDIQRRWEGVRAPSDTERRRSVEGVSERRGR